MQADVNSLVSYSAVVGMIIIAVTITSALLVINKLLGVKAREATHKKDDTYECGVDYVGTAHQQFSVRYYLVAIIFLLFDVEVVFMYPWTLTYKTYLSQSPFVIVEIVIFALALLAGYIYLRMRGAFDWD